MELVHQQGDRLAVILAGHPKLQYDLRRPAMEEIGARASVFLLEGFKGYQREYILWLLAQCTDASGEDVLTPEAVDALAASLATPLQVEQYYTLALEAAYGPVPLSCGEFGGLKIGVESSSFTPCGRGFSHGLQSCTSDEPDSVGE